MDLAKLKAGLKKDFISSSSTEDLQKLKVKYLGKKGKITNLSKQLGKLDIKQRPKAGKKINELKLLFEELNQSASQKIEKKELETAISKEQIDVSLPVDTNYIGGLHPITRTIEKICSYFSAKGYLIEDGPEIESEYYNFDALNIPPEHPARQEFDTFYVEKSKNKIGEPNVLRTHTSPVQIRHMEKNNGVPCRIIVPGKVFRSDYDQTHTPMFNQLEGLAIDKDINMGHLKWTLEEFCRVFFDIDDVVLRFRSSHFPFTEPSAEVDIKCSWDDGLLKLGQGESWLEILGSGMVHPNVLMACNVDPSVYQGFALGMGIDRLAMLKYGIPDLSSFFDSDIRWLDHYGFDPLHKPSIHNGL